MKLLSLDFGTSTCDMAIWNNNSLEKLESFETVKHAPIESFKSFIDEVKIDIEGVDKIFISGGKSRFFEKSFLDIPLIYMDEIEAIGRGGMILAEDFVKEEEGFLVVSLGTGTCMVKVEVSRQWSVVSKNKFQNPQSLVLSTQYQIHHIGGTGIGGGTFLGLCREILGITDINEIRKLFEKGNSKNVDLSVGEIVGSGIGIVSSENTASNLGKLMNDIEFKKEDLAAGIVNLVAQAIATNIVFAAKAENVKKIVLIGKLTRFTEIVDIIVSSCKKFDFEVILPKNAEFGTVIGAKK